MLPPLGLELAVVGRQPAHEQVALQPVPGIVGPVLARWRARAQRIAAPAAPRASGQAEGSITLTSRTTGAPCQSATPIQRGRPRLPVPAVRRAVRIFRLGLRHGGGERLDDSAAARARAWPPRSCSRTWRAALSEHHHQLAQPGPVAVEHDRPAARRAPGDSPRGWPRRSPLARRSLPFRPRQQGAGRQADEIERVGHLGGLVEVVDAPHQAAVVVAPGAEVLQVDVADGEHVGRARQVRADLEDGLGPAPDRCRAGRRTGSPPIFSCLRARSVSTSSRPSSLRIQALVGAHGLLDARHALLPHGTISQLAYDAINRCHPIPYASSPSQACAAASSSSKIRAPASPARRWSRRSCALLASGGASVTRIRSRRHCGRPARGAQGRRERQLRRHRRRRRRRHHPARGRRPDRHGHAARHHPRRHRQRAGPRDRPGAHARRPSRACCSRGPSPRSPAPRPTASRSC